MRSGSLISILLLFSWSLLSQNCYERFSQPQIDSFELQEDVRYGSGLNYLGLNQDLFLDIYLPRDDSEDKRPVVLIAHGGYFLFGSKDDIYIDSIALDLVRRGYIAVPVGYRVGANILSPEVEMDIARAAVRGIQDLKLAARFIKDKAIEQPEYRIDPDQVFVLGYSAGAVAGMALQFLNEDDELAGTVEQVIDQMGGIQGSAGPSYMSEVKAGVYLSGGTVDTSWIDAGEGSSLFVHGMIDDVISPFYDTVTFLGTPVIPILGSVHSHARQRHVGNLSEIFLMGNADHYWPLADSSYAIGMEVVFDWLARQVDCRELMARNEGMRIYPVPVTDHLWVHLQEDAMLGGEIRIYDISGRLVWSYGPVEFPYLFIQDMSSWTNGTYYLLYNNDIAAEGREYPPILFNKL